MTKTALPQEQTPIEAQTVGLEFPDNRLLIVLCGQFDHNLALLEAEYSIQIMRRGNQLSLIGEPDATAQASRVLNAQYQRLEAGGDIDVGSIGAEIKMGEAQGAARKSGGHQGGQLEMFKGGKVEITTRKKLVEPRTDAQKKYVESLYAKELVFGIGPAGTGKTYLAVAVGVSMFLAGKVDRIILSRPAVEAGERLGFLPGDLKDKVDPFMQPLYDALADFLPSKQVARMIEEKEIEIAPLAFMRGRTLSNAFVVLDEAQNATAMQMKMFLTRLGKNSRMVITGDRSQVDLQRGVVSGLHEAERLLKGIDKIAFNYFTAKDVVRHPLVAEIIEAYEADDG